LDLRKKNISQNCIGLRLPTVSWKKCDVANWILAYLQLFPRTGIKNRDLESVKWENQLNEATSII